MNKDDKKKVFLEDKSSDSEGEERNPVEDIDEGDDFGKIDSDDDHDAKRTEEMDLRM